MARPGDSPARTAAGRDGGADRARVANGQAAYSLAFPTGDRATSIVLLEATGPEQVRLGQPYNYDLKVTNLTDTPLNDVRVERLTPRVGPESMNVTGSTGTTRPTTRPGAAGMAARDPARNAAGEARPAAARAGGDDDANPVTAERVPGPVEVWSVGSLQPKESKTRQMSGTADEEGVIGNCLSVAYRPTLCVLTRVVKPELQVVKEGPAQVLICNPITYTYRVTNTGTGALTGVRVEDQLPEGLTAAEGGGRTVSANVGDLREGETKTVTAAVRPARTGTFASRATARSGEIAAQSREVSTVIREPALAVNVEGPQAQYVGQAINYRVTVQNTSDVPAEGTVVRLSSVGGSERLPDQTIGTLPPRESRSFQVNIGPARAGQPNASLTAAAQATCARPAQDSASVNILTIPALQLECVDGQDPVIVGQNTTYTVTVRNEGSGADNNIELKAVLPPELQFVRAGAGGASNITAQGQNLTFGPVPTLASGATATWTIEVKALRPADARFYVEMNSSSLGRPAAETEPTRITTGDAARDVQQGAPVVPQGGAGPAPAGERPQGQQNNKQ
jgi:uncharacterized repeat protein (TIGR01451 family)